MPTQFIRTRALLTGSPIIIMVAELTPPPGRNRLLAGPRPRILTWKCKHANLCGQLYWFGLVWFLLQVRYPTLGGKRYKNIINKIKYNIRGYVDRNHLHRDKKYLTVKCPTSASSDKLCCCKTRTGARKVNHRHRTVSPCFTACSNNLVL